MFCSRQIAKPSSKDVLGFQVLLEVSSIFPHFWSCICLLPRFQAAEHQLRSLQSAWVKCIWHLWLGCVYCVSDVWGLSVFQYAILWYTNKYNYIYNYMIIMYDDVWECYIQFIRMLRTCHGGRNWFTGFPPVPRCLAQTTTDLGRSPGGRANLFLSGDAESHRESVILQNRMKNQA